MKTYTREEVEKLFKQFHKLIIYGSTNQNPYEHNMNISTNGKYIHFENWLKTNLK
jgi:hypothetical protein